MHKLAPHIFVEASYPGVNVGAIWTSRGFICIDVPSYPRNARDWVARLQQMSPHPIRYLVLTDDHGDRIVNSRWMSAPIICHEVTSAHLDGFEKRYPQPMIDSLTLRDPFSGRELSGGPVEPAAISFSDDLQLEVDGRSLLLLHRPGPRPGSLWLHLPQSGVLFAGDHLVTAGVPPLVGARLESWLAAWEDWQPPLSQVHSIVPGRGPIPETAAAARRHLAFLEKVQASLVDFMDDGLPRDKLSTLLPSLLDSVEPGDGSQDWQRHQLLEGLQYLFDDASPAPAEATVDTAPPPEPASE